MKISFLCDSKSHPIIPFLDKYVLEKSKDHVVNLVFDKSLLESGDILFLVSCNSIISPNDKSKFGICFVLHASDLPRGRGWSPHIWQILEGESDVTVTLLLADERVDRGKICHQKKIEIQKTDLCDDINKKLFEAEFSLMDYAIENFKELEFYDQDLTVEASYYPKREPKDSELDPNKTITEQFDLIRVSDPHRFPAFFKLFGKTFKLSIERVEDE